MNLFLDRPVLPVGTNSLLAMAPQVIHRVQFGTSDRQPNQLDSEALRVALRGLGRMATVPVQDERHPPSSVLLMNQPEELLEVFFPLLLPLQEQPCPVGGVECAEEHPLGVGSAQGDLGVFAAPCPAGSQRGEQQQVGLVLEQHDISRSQPLDIPADPSHLRGPVRVRVQDVARPFPDVTQGMQLAAHRGIAESGQTPVSQMRLEQWDGPRRGLVAEVIRRLVQGGPQDGLGVLVPFRGPACAVMGDQGTWGGMMSVGRDPTVDRAATDTEPDGDLGDGAAPVEFEQTEGTTVGAQIVG